MRKVPWGHGEQSGWVAKDPREGNSDNPKVVNPAGRVHCSMADWARNMLINHLFNDVMPPSSVVPTQSGDVNNPGTLTVKTVAIKVKISIRNFGTAGLHVIDESIAVAPTDVLLVPGRHGLQVLLLKAPVAVE